MARSKASTNPITNPSNEGLRLLTITLQVIPELVTIPDAAKLANISRQRMHTLVNRGQIGVYQIGGVLFVSKQDARSYTPNPIGRPASQ